jgi:hypothetical protein
LAETKSNLEENMKGKFNRLKLTIDTIETSLNKSIELSNKAMERLKIEVSDEMIRKTDSISNILQMDLSFIKKNYDETMELITEASKNFGTLFKTKLTKMKSTMAKLLIDVEIKIEQHSKDMSSMNYIITDW